MKKFKRFIIFLILILLLLLISVFSLKYFKNLQTLENNKLFEEQKKQEEIKNEQDEKFNNCMNSPYKDEQIDSLFEELENTLNKSNISIYFQEISNDYIWTFNEDKVYYAASLIKLFEASYLINQARSGNINLNDTLTYTKPYLPLAGLGMENHHVGENITLKTLLQYSIQYSDNAAHILLIDYIGVNNLKNYVKDNLNVNLTISENDKYGYLTVKETNILLNYVMEIFKVDDEYTNLLKNAMHNDYNNALNFDDIFFLHKYGYYSYFYHDIGIYDSDEPYLISIFTSYGNEDHSHLSKVSEISKQIFNIYKTNLEKKEQYCKNIAYN